MNNYFKGASKSVSQSGNFGPSSLHLKLHLRSYSLHTKRQDDYTLFQDRTAALLFRSANRRATTHPTRQRLLILTSPWSSSSALTQNTHGIKTNRNAMSQSAAPRAIYREAVYAKFDSVFTRFHKARQAM